MTLVKILDDLRKWCEDNICTKVSLKLPNDAKITHEVEYVHPAAFALFVPAKDRLPPNVQAPIPSVCVQMMDGNDKPNDHRRILNVRLCLACWNPGTQSGEVLTPAENHKALFAHLYTQGQTGIDTYSRNLDGWRDVWNFADIALREVEASDIIAGLRLLKEEGITYGPFTEEGVVWDYYPYWHSWISFKLEGGLVLPTPAKIQDLL